MKRISAVIIMACLVIAGCTTPTTHTGPSQATLALTGATLIDGTGAQPIPDTTLVIAGERIIAAGPSAEIIIPSGAKIIDLDGAYILPGFINAHVHDAYDSGRLQAWAQAGVTTVRDEGILSSPSQISQKIALRNELAASNQYARLVSAGYMMTVPGGYGHLEVTSVEDAQKQVKMELEEGVDLIKVTMEDGYGFATNLPLLSGDELSAIVSAAHLQGALVSAHVTETKFLQQVVDAGVDDAAHIPWDVLVSPSLIQKMVDQDVYVVTTLTVMDAYGSAAGASRNLARLQAAGVHIAMGSDYTLIPQNNFDHFELGMPMHEIYLLTAAGLSPMEIVVASTRNAAHVCGLEDELGTLQADKLADVLVVSANPLEDLSALTQVRMVIHNGEIIRQ